MRLIAAFPQKLFWQLFVPRLIICTMQVAYGHSIIAHRVHSGLCPLLVPELPSPVAAPRFRDGVPRSLFPWRAAWRRRLCWCRWGGSGSTHRRVRRVGITSVGRTQILQTIWPDVFLAFGGFLILTGKLHFGYISRHRPDGLRGHVLPAEPDVHAGLQHARDGVGARLLSVFYCAADGGALGVSIVLSLQGALGMALDGLTILQPVGVQTIRHGLSMDHRRPLVCYPLSPALRRVRPAHHSGMVALTSSDLLRRPVWPMAAAGGGHGRRPVLMATDADFCAVQSHVWQ